MKTRGRTSGSKGRRPRREPAAPASVAPPAADPATTTAAELITPEVVGPGAPDIPEPGEGAHSDHAATARAVREAVVAALRELAAHDTADLLATRYARLRGMGAYLETGEGSRRPPEAPSLRRRIGRILHLPGVPRRPRWSEIWPSDGDDEQTEGGA